MFVYKTDEELFVKGKLEENLRVVEKASRNTESFVNASFAMQGIQQALSDDRQMPHVLLGCWRLCEASGYLQSLTLLLNMEESEDNDEEDEDNDDDERVNIILNAMITLLSDKAERFRDRMLALTLTEESAIALIESLKRSLTEENTTVKYIHCTIAFLEQPSNVPLIIAACNSLGGVADIFGTAARFYQGNADLVRAIDKVTQTLQ